MGTRSANTWLDIQLSSTLTHILDVGTVTVDAIDDRITEILDSGLAANECDRGMVTDVRTITAGDTDDIDLYDWENVDVGNGYGYDALGLSLVIEQIVIIIIKHVSGTGSLEILGSVPTGYATWCPKLTVANGGALKEGGVLCLYQPKLDGFGVDSYLSHRLRFGAVGGSVSYQVFVAARHDELSSSSQSTSSSSSSSSTIALSTSSQSETSQSSASSLSTESSSSSSSSTLSSQSTSSSQSTTSTSQSSSSTSQSSMSESSMSESSLSELGSSSSSSSSSSCSSGLDLTSKQGRMAAIQMLKPYCIILPPVDGTMTQEDRQQTALSYITAV